MSVYLLQKSSGSNAEWKQNMSGTAHYGCGGGGGGGGDGGGDNNNNNNNNTAEYPTDVSGVRKLFTLTEDKWRHYVAPRKVRNHLIVWYIVQFNFSFSFYRPSKVVELSKK